MIEKVTTKNFNDVLPLIKEYQKFYAVKKINDNKNKQFFYQFAENNNKGILHLYKLNNLAIGFTTLYKGFSSTRAEEVAILNDLYIQPQYRHKGYAKELLNNAIHSAKSMGYSRLQWLTAEDNSSAQQFYDNFDVNKSCWMFYTTEL